MNRSRRIRRIAAYLDSPEPAERATAERRLAELGYSKPHTRSVDLQRWGSEADDLAAAVVQARGGKITGQVLEAHPIALPRLYELAIRLQHLYRAAGDRYDRQPAILRRFYPTTDKHSFWAGLTVGLLIEPPMRQNTSCTALVRWYGDESPDLPIVSAPIKSRACFEAGVSAAARFNREARNRTP